MSLSVVVLTYNSARTLERCLKSVQFADEILIVDSGSTDETLEIAKIYTSRILHHPYINYGKQLNWAIEKVKGDWILVVDSDEEVTPELAQEIKNAVRENEMDGYYLPRISEFMGKRLIHVWAQDKVLRLFRKGKAKYKERELGSSPIVEGELGNLRGYLLHFPYKDLTHYLEKFNFYTSCAAREIRKKRKATLFDLLLRPPAKFIKMFFIKRGFLDGIPGLIMCMLSAFYVFVKYAKAWERR
ncbi:MAG TPA: glycosyltransferase family 2 protein [bacterium]|nr:glycosyltransferase family 2 protein [bacterium]HEX68094.1 glycosyltransferase family 2 protein [bacterium]